mgnify:CR=1 FL=1
MNKNLQIKKTYKLKYSKMKVIKLFMPVLLALSAVGVLNGCYKDNDSESKTITIYTEIKPINFSIYAIENTDIPIYYDEMKYNDMFEFDLNIGNYVISTGTVRVGFQVVQSKSTIITIDKNRSASVEYK